ncbi:MAG: transposase [Alicyclobacillus sp.]|nr:transposase [Alicyclobacillus sp.]
MRFIIEQSDETITTHSGLSLVGLLLNKTTLGTRLNKTVIDGMGNPDISNRNVAYSYLGLLCQGKSDFDHIEPFRDDEFFRAALQINAVPSSPTLRQRLDMAAQKSGWETIILEESANLLRNLQVPITPVYLGQNKDRPYIPLDIDVSPFDNSGTKKEGVSRTYKGHDGYAPIFAYIGLEGYAVNVNLRDGKTYFQKDTDKFLAQSIRYSKSITSIPLLVRMDAGNDHDERAC